MTKKARNNSSTAGGASSSGTTKRRNSGTAGGASSSGTAGTRSTPAVPKKQIPQQIEDAGFLPADKEYCKNITHESNIKSASMLVTKCNEDGWLHKSSTELKRALRREEIGWMLSREDLLVAMPMDYSPTVVFFKQSDLDFQHLQLLLDCFRSMDVVLNKMLEDWKASNEVPESYLELQQICKDFMESPHLRIKIPSSLEGLDSDFNQSSFNHNQLKTLIN